MATDETEHTGGRGAAAILAAKLVFLVGGYMLVLGVSRSLSTEDFGAYSVINGVTSLFNMIFITGTLQTTSRFVATNPAAAEAVRAQLLRYQVVFASVLLGLIFISSPLIAAALHDERLTTPLRWASLVTGCYAFYAVNVGSLNGRRLFLRQAGLDISFTVLKVSATLVLTWLGFRVAGAIAGFVIAAVLIVIASFAVTGFPRATTSPGAMLPSVGALVRFAGAVLGVAALLNLFLQADLLLLKRLSPGDVADREAGLYAAAQQVARVPYYLTATAALVLFPAMARLSRDGADERHRADVATQGFSAVLGIIAGGVAITWPLGGHLLAVLFPPSFIAAGSTLSHLLVAMGLLSLLYVMVTMLSGAGRPGVALGVLGLSVAAQTGAASVLTPRLGRDGAAMATAMGAGVGLLIACLVARRVLGWRLPWRVVVWVSVACLVSSAVAIAWADRWSPTESPRLLTVAFVALNGLLYLGLLTLGGVVVGLPASVTRVLLVSKALSPPFNDGAKVLVHELSKRLAAPSIAVLTSRGAAKLIHDVQTFAIYGKSGFSERRLEQNVRVFVFLLLFRYHFRGLHFFFAPNRMTSRVIALLRLISPGVRFFQTVMSRPKRFAELPSLLFGDVVIAHSQHTLSQLGPGRRALLVRPGVTVPETPRSGTSREQLHLLYAGDLDDGGGPEHLERIVPALLAANSMLHFHLSVRSKSATTLARAQRLYDALSSGHPSRTTLHVERADFEALLDLQHAMLLPVDELYRKVDAPLVALETMARGKPVFVLNRPPLDELVPVEAREVLLASDDASFIALVVRWSRGEAMVDPEVLVRHVRENFSIERYAERHRQLYEGLANG